MAEQNYEVKRALSSSATSQPLNKKSALEYIVDPDGPTPSLLLRPLLRLQTHTLTHEAYGPRGRAVPICVSPLAHGKTGEDLDHPSNPDPPRGPASSPSPPHALEIEDDFKNEDHYPCLPDLNKYLPFEDNPRYNIVTVESVPESPRSEGKFPNLPSVTPSLEASPAGAAAWGHRAISQESKDKGPTAFGSHHCSHPGPLGPAIVSWVNSPGLGPIRFLNTIGEDAHSLSMNHADLGEPIRSGCGDKFNANSTLYNVDFSNQPIKLHASQDARRPAALSNPGILNQPIRSHSSWDASAQHALYNSRDLAQPINSSSTTCNSMHMASSEFSNLGEPITPDDTIEVDSANILINDCNLAGPITPDNVMDVDSPNALINKCNLYEPIKPLDAMETDTPDVLSNNCNSDGPIRPGTAGAEFAHPDQAGCPTPGHPIRSWDAEKTNAPNLLSNYCNSDGPIRSSAAGAKFNCSDQAGCPTHGQPIKPCNTKKTNVPNLLSNYCNSDGPIRSGAAGAKFNCSDQAGCPTHGQPIKPCNTKTSNMSQSDLALLVQI
ncbi:hypothetical protein DSO57_1017637 [Entomophthora muscae]|uniref:Uncharacterized protein n=1 Tax=Entomophthora muscae TaxID=34485 RepID=A0ACC2RW12_9FUNG|nr:hypothetical protein DSO57_1017637 [Entomophthora muscae]